MKKLTDEQQAATDKAWWKWTEKTLRRIHRRGIPLRAEVSSGRMPLEKALAEVESWKRAFDELIAEWRRNNATADETAKRKAGK